MNGREDITCKELVELVTEYIQGTLPEDDRAHFEAHLEICEGCRAYVDQMRETAGAAGRLSESELPPETREGLLETFRGWKRERGM